MNKRVYNFNPGPAALPLSVLEEAKKDLINYKGEGLSVMEMSHRGKIFESIIKGTEALVKEVFNIPSGYKVLFMQGGATLQFAAVPLNLIGDNQSADYIISGSWAKKAFQETEKLGKKANKIASSEDKNYSYIPKDYIIKPDAAYLHITSNNTIFGTQWQKYPDSRSVPLVADMSSDIACRPIDINSFGLIYAGAQKNIGPSGITMVIIREDLMAKSPANIASIMSYKISGENDSLYNTPPTFTIYMVKLVFEWIKNSGGLNKIAEINNKKATLVYNIIDSTDFYRGTAEKDSRSIMNITFRLPNEELEKKFIEEATKNSMIGLKGHRSVGGIRASIYNAVSLDALNTLSSFMKEFEKKNG
jgi:phosphoserine aminotransferase